MNYLPEYATPLTRETLELIKYHKRRIMDLEQSGFADPEAKQKLKFLDEFQENIHFYLDGIKAIKDSEIEKQAKLLKFRKIAECEVCNAMQPVTIVREEKNEKLNVMCDIVVCDVCKTEFLNIMPNNFHDRIIFYEYLIKILSPVIEKESKKKKPNPDIKGFILIVEEGKRYIATQLEIERKENRMKQAIEDMTKSIEGTYDRLLLAKISGLNRDDLKSFVN